MPWRRKDAARASSESPFSLGALAEVLSYGGLAYGVPGMQPTLPGQRQEQIGGQFRSLATGAFKANSVVFACMATRMRLFSEARFQFQQLRTGGPGNLFGTDALAQLETPWAGGTTGDLLARMIQHADLAGNAFVARRPDSFSCLRPDWTTLIIGSLTDPSASAWDVDAQVIGYLYKEGGEGSGKPAEIFDAGEVAHFAPIPDPEARFRGMSWLTPLIREVMADKAMTDHELAFFEGGASPSRVVKLDITDLEKFKAWVEIFESKHAGGAQSAYKDIFLGAGADVTVVGTDLQQLEFSATRGHGETRIAAAAGVPPIIVGLSEGLAAATYCLPASEDVWTLDGPRPIVDLRPGDQVWSSDGAPLASRVEWQGCVGQKEVFEIRTKNRVLQATDNHPVLVRVPGNSRGSNATRSPRVEWRAVGELRPGDKIVEAKSLPDAADVRPEWASDELVQWLGAYMGDGSGAGGESLRIAMPPGDRVREHYERLTAELFDSRVGFEHRGFRIYGRAASEMVGMLGFAGSAKTKQIPGWVFRLPREQRLRFLAGLIDSDGHIDKLGNGVLGFASKRLVEQSRALFVSCGIQVSNVRYRRQMAAGLPQPGTRLFYDMWTFSITSGLGIVPTADSMYAVRLEARRDAAEGGDIGKAGLDPDLYGFFTIRSIETKGVQPVYDISVRGEQSFLASGVAVHNSNYGQARRALADGTLWPLWRNAAGSLARIVDVPERARLWIDATGIAFLREDEKDAAEIQSTKSITIRQLIDAGYEPDAVIDAVVADDFTRLAGKHTGLFSVQLQEPGSGDQGASGPPIEDGSLPRKNGSRDGALAALTEG